MLNSQRYPFIDRINSIGQTSTLPYLPIALSNGNPNRALSFGVRKLKAFTKAYGAFFLNLPNFKAVLLVQKDCLNSWHDTVQIDETA
jgi:hypothetical protein